MLKNFSINDAKLNIEILFANIESFDDEDQLETIEYLDNMIKQFKLEYFHENIKLEKESTDMKKDQPKNMQNASDEEALDKFKMLGTLRTVISKSDKFKCIQCEKILSSKENLQNHMYSVHGSKKHMCDKCPYRSSRSRDLGRHKNNMHKKNGR